MPHSSWLAFLGFGLIPVLVYAEDAQPNATSVFTAEEKSTASSMLSQHARGRMSEANQRSTAAWRELKTKEAWEVRRDDWIAALRKSLGEFPAAPTNMRVEITNTQEMGDVRIDSLVYESRPGWFVTANLYSPKQRPTKMPAFILSHSHHTPKHQNELQDMGQLWAKAGCYVLVPDHLGHGERRQHPFRTAEDYPAEKYQVSRQDYHFRYNTAAQLYLIGDSLMGWMAWDLMRGVDLLLKQPNIDSKRIIILGSVAGGGDPAAVAAALDPRITGLCPMNFGGPQPETKYPLPEDAEARFNYAGGGSWESTRNLRRSAADGFLPWVIVGSVAPRGLVHGHEFTWDRERDPVWRRYEQLFAWYGSDHLGVTHGYGAVTQSSDMASHCNNIGKLHRAPMHDYFAKWFDIHAKEETFEHLTAEQLFCLKGEQGSQVKTTPLHVLATKQAVERSGRAMAELKSLDKQQAKEALALNWKALLGDIEPAAAVEESRGSRELTLAGGGKAKVGVYLLRAGDILLPTLLLSRTDAQDKQPTIVVFAQQGKEAWLKQRGDQLAELLATHQVCLVDLRGCGETKLGNDRGRRSEATSIWATELMLGETLIGSRLKDLRTTLAWLRKQPSVAADKLVVYGDSLAVVNSAETVVAIPLELNQPAIGEPMGAIVALLAGLYEDQLTAIVARGGLLQYRQMLAGQFIHVAHDAIVPGGAAVGDLPLVMQHVSIPLLYTDCINGVNRRVSENDRTAAMTGVPLSPQTTVSLVSSDRDIVKWLSTIIK